MFSAKAETIITADEGVRGGKIIPLKQTVDNAITGCECVKRVLVATRTGANVPMVPDRDYKLEELIAVESTECPPEPMNSEDPLFMLYTSGSTGKPKGILHTQAGYLLYTGLTQQVIDSSIHPFIHSFIHASIHSLTYASILPLILSSMCLTTNQEIYLPVWLILVGSLVIHILYMVH